VTGEIALSDKQERISDGTRFADPDTPVILPDDEIDDRIPTAIFGSPSLQRTLRLTCIEFADVFHKDPIDYWPKITESGWNTKKRQNLKLHHLDFFLSPVSSCLALF
jgi:hypothetical protein